MDTINAIVETLIHMGEVFWPMKYWILAVALALAVIWYYSPTESYVPPAPARTPDSQKDVRL